MWQRTSRQIGWMAIDALLLAGALALAYQLRFDFETPDDYTRQFHALVIPVVAIELTLLWLLGLYRRMTQFAGAGELLITASALFIGLVIGGIYYMVEKALGRTAADPSLAPWQWPIPRPVLLTNFLAGAAAVGGARLVRRLTLAWPAGYAPNARRTLIAGATDVGDFAVRLLRRNPAVGLRPVAFLDEAGALRGRTIQGLPIVGALPDLAEVVRQWKIEEVLIALPGGELEAINRVVEQCRRAGVPVRVLPGQNELIAGRRTLGALRPVDVHEVLGRERLDETLDEAMNYVRGEVVLVTGAGGSIGSELCRQIIALGPSRLVMVGRGENSLFELQQALGPDGPERRCIVANVQDEAKMAQVFGHHRPALIFHAAAHKHVPLMENDPDEAVKNNILATDLLARLADAHGAKRFVLISTDKAVRPTAVMGASKRVAEQIISAWAGRSPCRFVAVRFGNVLGSRGSVVPIFRRQIEHGGPVTVTDPAAERYFMTVREAVSLVLRAGAVAESGQLCVLDMGEPVKIVDLARDMIRLSGYSEEEVKIVFTGLRPGEKLFEELLADGEHTLPTPHPKLRIARAQAALSAEEMADLLAWLRGAPQEEQDVKQRLMRFVPEYRPRQTE